MKAARRAAKQHDDPARPVFDELLDERVVQRVRGVAFGIRGAHAANLPWAWPRTASALSSHWMAQLLGSPESPPRFRDLALLQQDRSPHRFDLPASRVRARRMDSSSSQTEARSEGRRADTHARNQGSVGTII